VHHDYQEFVDEGCWASVEVEVTHCTSPPNLLERGVSAVSLAAGSMSGALVLGMLLSQALGAQVVGKTVTGRRYLVFYHCFCICDSQHGHKWLCCVCHVCICFVRCHHCQGC